MNYYVASRFRNKPVLKALRDLLQAKGHRCTSTWLDVNPDAVLEREAACQDILDMDNAQALVLYTEGCELVPGGLWFEQGYMYAQNKLVYRFGPICNIFNQVSIDAVQLARLVQEDRALPFQKDLLQAMAEARKVAHTVKEPVNV